MKVFCYVFLISILPMRNAKNYCRNNICNNSKQHTLCKFQSEDPARHCIDYEKTIRSQKEKLAILDKLNSRRNKVAAGEIRSLPSAESMMKLEWNEELQKSAQRWVNQCARHTIPDLKDMCRDLDEVYVGQNIATIHGEAPGLTPVALVDVWYMELLNVNASVLSQYQPSTDTGYSHYDYFTQLVWAESNQVGCGGVKFKERMHVSDRVRNRTIYRLVCNFAPGGNIQKQPVYKEGLPCSRCPHKGNCDSVYKALCTSETSTEPISKTNETLFTTTFDKITLSEKIKLSTVTKSTEISSSTEPGVDEENYTPFDYFSHLHEFTRPSLTTTDKSSVSCKDFLAVDDFVELLKKKLSTDPMFKDILLTTKLPVAMGNIDGLHTDATMAALVSRLYSKKIPSTTTKLPQNEFVNSTLLVDLVEAVIFRSGDKVRAPEGSDRSFLTVPDVNPIKIQAELAEVRQNADFTGHYFFPEDTDNEESSETTESYYDTSDFPTSDVVLEIEDLKRNKQTKDFLEEILESESATERLDFNNVVDFKREVNEQMGANDKTVNAMRNKRQSMRYVSNYDVNENNGQHISDEDVHLRRYYKHECTSSLHHYVINYRDLLKKIALDLKVLKLNERFHCTRNYSIKSSYMNVLIIFSSLLNKYLE